MYRSECDARQWEQYHRRPQRPGALVVRVCKSGFEHIRSVRPVLARREEAAGLPPARTSKEASAGRAIRVRSELAQKVRLNKGESSFATRPFGRN